MKLKRIETLLGQRRPGHTLPQALYCSDEVHEFDMNAVFGESWLMVGMACELPKPGSYMALTIGKWPVVLTRDAKGEVRAFHNTCRHRGSVLCQPGHGSAPKLVCPYHRWTYNLDGALFAATRMPGDFDKSTHGLKPVAVRVVAGGLFICLADDPPAFDEFGNRFSEYAGQLNFADMKLAATDLMVEQANWKLVMDNARECYHCPTSHPDLAKSFPVVFSGFFDADGDAHAAAYVSQMDALGLPHEPVQGDWWQMSRIALNEGATTISMDGQLLVKKLLVEGNNGSIGSFRWALEPNMFAHATSDQVFMCTFVPISATETHAYSKWFVHKDAVEGVDYNVDDLKEVWIKTNLQDRALAENNHRGVVSPGYTPGPYSPDAETLALGFTDWYCAKARAYIDAHVG